MRKQTLKDSNCLVPCSGLFADVSDNSLEQKMMTGAHIFQNHPNHVNSGFRTLTEGLSENVKREQLYHLQQMVSNSAERKTGHESAREWYKSYKESYVKHLQFVPDKTDRGSSFHTKANRHLRISGAVIEHSPLEAVYIFFDTATFDEIERDVKVVFFQAFRLCHRHCVKNLQG